MRGNNDRLIIVVMQGHDGTMQLQVREEKCHNVISNLVFFIFESLRISTQNQIKQAFKHVVST